MLLTTTGLDLQLTCNREFMFMANIIAVFRPLYHGMWDDVEILDIHYMEILNLQGNQHRATIMYLNLAEITSNDILHNVRWHL